MPGIASHMVVAKLVGEKLKLNSDDFIQGNIMPDILLMIQFPWRLLLIIKN